MEQIVNRHTEHTALAEPLQQVDRTFVLRRGRKLSYFGGCDYFRLSSHPAVLTAIREGLQQFGLNVAASRKTTGNHPLYEKLEGALAAFFGVEAAVLVSSGYVANLVVAQAVTGEFTHALIDERAHGSLFDAASLLGCPVLPFKHRDAADARRAARIAGRRAKLLLLTDGLYSHSGQVAPLGDYLRLLPKNTVLLVDDAHGSGTLGRFGRGTVEFLGASDERIIQTVTLSKALGVYGGAVLGSRRLRDRIVSRSRLFTGNTPLPLPLANAALTALKVVRADARLRRRLLINTRYVKAALSEAGFPVPDGPGPIAPIEPRDAKHAESLRRRLLARGIHPPLIRYPGGLASGYFRFAISSEHSAEQLDALVQCIATLER
jgi:7-keto-8-aminopelargonate synthetase-like enzyme